jgi:hypothetical protein
VAGSSDCGHYSREESRPAQIIEIPRINGLK